MNVQVSARFGAAARLALTEELLEALRQVFGVEARHRVVVLASRPRAVRPRHSESAGRRRRPTGRRLLRSSTLVGGALGRVAALALLALRLLRATALARARDPRHAGQSTAAPPRHRLHHLLRVAEADEQLVDLGHGDTGALGDAGAT